MPKVAAISGSFDIDVRSGINAITRVIKATEQTKGSLIETKLAEKSVGDEFVRTGQKAKQSGTEIEKASKKSQSELEKTRQKVSETNKELDKTKSTASDVIQAMAGIATSIGFSALIGGIVSVNGQFERYSAILKTAYGSSTQAAQAFGQIRDIAKTTPFQLENVTQSWINLKNRGIEPTAETMTRLGDLASSQGRNIEDAVQAVTAAMTGETEMLKGFGIIAKQEGDRMLLSFKGVNTEIQKTPTAIFEALTAMGAMEGVAGSMSGIAVTMEGSISNLQDNVTELKNSIGEDLAPVIKSMISATSDLIKGLMNWKKENPALARTIVQISTAVLGLVTLFIGGNGLMAAMKTMKPVVDALGISMKTAFGPIGLIISGITIAAGALLFKLNQIKAAEDERKQGADNYTASLGKMNTALSKAGQTALSNTEKNLKELTTTINSGTASVDQIDQKMANLRITGEQLGTELAKTGINVTQFMTRLRSDDPRTLMTTLSALRKEMARFEKEQKKGGGGGGGFGGASRDQGFVEGSLRSMENELASYRDLQERTVVAGSQEWDEYGKKIAEVEDRIRRLRGAQAENIDTGMFENLKQALTRVSPAIANFLKTGLGRTVESILAGASQMAQGYVQMLNAAANLAESKGRRISGISNWLAEGMILNIDKNLEAQKNAADEELKVIEQKNKAIIDSEKRMRAELEAILNEYKNKRKTELDEEYNAEVERRRLELEDQYAFIEANSANEAEANIAKLLEFDRFEAEKEELRRQYDERLAQDTQLKEEENSLIMENEAQKNLSMIEEMNKRKEEIEAQELERERQADAEKTRIQKHAAQIQYASELYAFTARKTAKMAEARIAMLGAVMNAVAGGIQLAATFPPFTIPAGLAFTAGMTAMAYKTGQMTQQAISMELPPLPPQFAKGGMVGGRPHSQGGTLIEAERGEYVVNAQATRQNISALEAINSGKTMAGSNISLYFENHFSGEGYFEIRDRLMIDIRDSLRSAYSG